MSESSFSFTPEPSQELYASFLLDTGDTITIYGTSIEHIFFQLSAQIPEGFPCKAIGFSGKDIEESASNLQHFLGLVKRFKNP